MNKVRIHQGRVLVSGHRYMLSLVLVCGMITSIIAINNIFGFIIAVLLSFLMMMVWTSVYILEIDMERQTYCDFTFVFGYKFGSAHSFDSVEEIFINSTRSSQIIYGFGANSYTRRNHDFDAYLKFSNGKKIFLTSDTNEKELVRRLQPIARKLGTQIKLS